MLVSKYQSYMLDLEYNVMAYIGNLLSTYSLLPRLRSALCEYRISLLGKSIELSKAAVHITSKTSKQCVSITNPLTHLTLWLSGS